MSWDAAHAIATIVAAGVSVVGAVLGGNYVLTRLIVRDEISGLDKKFVPRKEHELEHGEVDRRLGALEAKAATR